MVALVRHVKSARPLRSLAGDRPAGYGELDGIGDLARKRTENGRPSDRPCSPVVAEGIGRGIGAE